MKLCSECHHVFANEDTVCPDHGDKLKTDALIGKTLSSFHITGWLGEGGMGVLYKAEHDVIGRKAAVKVIRGEYITDEKMAGRFEQEARAVARIGHPHLIDIFDIGTTPDGRLYYVMELLEGRALSSRNEQERLDFQTFASIMIDACQALEAAHANQIVHRDLKPDNIFLVERPGEPPFVKVLDFGIAKVLGNDEDMQKKLTKTGSIIGTPQYMAPEQVRGGAIDARADVYALGVILYELSLGRLPFIADTMGALLVAHMLEQPPRFADAADAKPAPGLPPTMEAVVFRALAKEPANRYQSVRELREDLERVMAGTVPEAEKWWEEERARLSGAVTMPGGTSAQTMAVGGPAVGQTTQQVSPAAQTVQTSPPPAKRSGAPVTIGVFAFLALAGGAIVMFTPVHDKIWPPPPPPPPPVVVTPPAPPPPPPKKRGPDVPALRSKALGVIQSGLKHGDPVVRKQAAETIVEGREARHHTMVEPLLGDGDVQVGAAAADTLGKLGSRASVAPLREALGKQPSLDPFVGEALSKLGDVKDKKKVIDVLKKVLKSGPEADRFQAALALSDLGYKDARKLLGKVVKLANGDRGLEIGVLANLARNGDEGAKKKLAEMLDSGEPQLELQGARELARLGDERARAKLATLAGNASFPGRLLAYRILASLDDQSGFDTFSSTFNDSGKPLGERVLSAQGLGASGEPSALQTVGPALDDTQPALRLAAAGAVLAIAASDPRVQAATSLDWASDALADGSWAVRAQAAAVLADADAATSLPLLFKLLKDDDTEVRRSAVIALGKTKSAAAAPALDEALGDKQAEVRLLAIRALGDIGGEAATPILEKHVADAKGEEKALAAGQLLRLGKRTHLDELKDALASKDAEVRRVAVEQAAADPELGPETLRLALKDKSPKVQLQAAVLLAEKGSKDGEAVLEKAVKKGGSDGLRAYAALLAAGVEPTAQLDPQSLLASKDAKVRRRAVDEAGKLPEARALPFYKLALRDKDATIRMAALGRVGDLVGKMGKAALALIRAALKDEDAGVRARAESLMSRYAPKPKPEPEDDGAKKAPTGSANGKSEPAAPVAAPPDMATPEVVDLARPFDLAVAPLPPPPPRRHESPPDLSVGPDLLPRFGITEDNKREADLLYAGAEVELRAGQYADAVRDFKRAQKLDPNPNVWFDLGDAYRNLGEREDDPAKRRDYFEKAVAAYKKSNKAKAAAYATELEQSMAAP